MTMVLLHPVGLDHDCWQLCDLDGEKPDYPGHGGRTPPESGVLDFDAVADEIAAAYPGLLDLIGVSIGSTVAQYIALRHPSRVRSMLLACNSPGGEARRDRAADTLRLGMAATVEATLDRWFTPAALADPAHQGVSYARERLLTDDPAGVAAIWAADRSLLTAAAVGRIYVPVTVLGGRQDKAATVDRVTALSGLLPRCRLEVIAGPHMLPLERPHAFSDAVHRHLSWSEAERAETPGDRG
jgi:3-oxoadipate enol-lactonase